MRKEPTIVVVNENHDACWGGMTNFVLSVMNEGRMSSLAMTNVVHDEGQGRFEGLVDFGATNASRKATSKKVVQISSGDADHAAALSVARYRFGKKTIVFNPHAGECVELR